MGYINDYVECELNELRNCHRGVSLGFLTQILMFEFSPCLFFSRSVPNNLKKDFMMFAVQGYIVHNET